MSITKYTIYFSEEASAEVEAATYWYEEQRKGVGSEFMIALEAVLASVQRSPMLFPVAHRDVRRARLKRFPYGVFFRIKKDEIEIVSVFHSRRDPARLKSRL